MQYRNHTEEVAARIAEADAEREEETRRKMRAASANYDAALTRIKITPSRKRDPITAIECGLIAAALLGFLSVFILGGDPPH